MSKATTTRPPAPSRFGPTAAGCGLLAILIFAVDVVTPRGFSEFSLYVLVVFASFRSPGLPLAVAAGCSALAALGFFLSPSGAGPEVSLANRGFALVGVWLTYALGAERERLLAERDRLVAERESALTRALSQFIPICAWCKMVQGEGDEWQDLEKYVEAETESRFTHGICPGCCEKLEQRRPREPEA